MERECKEKVEERILETEKAKASEVQCRKEIARLIEARQTDAFNQNTIIKKQVSIVEDRLSNLIKKKDEEYMLQSTDLKKSLAAYVRIES